MDTSTTPNERPAKNCRSGSVNAAIWRNVPESGSPYFSVQLSRSYKKDEDWKTTDSFGARDLLDLRRVIASVEQFIAEQPL